MVTTIVRFPLRGFFFFFLNISRVMSFDPSMFVKGRRCISIAKIFMFRSHKFDLYVAFSLVNGLLIESLK